MSVIDMTDVFGGDRPLSANQLYKKSGSTLPFKEWITRESEKSAGADGGKSTIEGLNSAPLNDSIMRTLNRMSEAPEGKLQTSVSGNTVLGINKNILIGAGLIIGAGIAYKVYQVYHKKATS